MKTGCGIHADLHPGNMLISPDNYIWIFDLGLVDEMDWWMRNEAKAPVAVIEKMGDEFIEDE